MALRRGMFESKRHFQRRQEEERRRRARQRRRRKVNPVKELMTPVEELIKLPRRVLRKKLKQMTRSRRNKMKRQIRSRKRKIAKGMFGMCPVCAQPATPGHRCRVRFTPHNAKNIRNRLAKQGGIPVSRQNPNLWRTNGNPLDLD